jgi:hypothetical protein
LIIHSILQQSLLVSFGLLFSQSLGFGQINEPRAFEFLNLSPSARVTAMGGVNNSSAYDSLYLADINMFMTNPALLRPQAHNQVAINYSPYLADINYASVAYTWQVQRTGMFAIGIQYLDYGQSDSFDPAGASLGTFSSSDYAVTAGYSRQQNNFRLGASIKVAASSLAGYTANALVGDVGVSYIDPAEDLVVSLTFTNFGWVTTDYSPYSASELPADVRVGVSFKPQYMPFRFSISAHRLLNGTRAYFPEPGDPETGTGEKILRHVVLGGEIMLGKNLSILLGYNHLVSSALRLQQISGGAGLSFGLSLRLKTVSIHFGRGIYHVGGGFSQFTASVNLDQLIGRR